MSRMCLPERMCWHPDDSMDGVFLGDLGAGVKGLTIGRRGSKVHLWSSIIAPSHKFLRFFLEQRHVDMKSALALFLLHQVF